MNALAETATEARITVRRFIVDEVKLMIRHKVSRDDAFGNQIRVYCKVAVLFF